MYSKDSEKNKKLFFFNSCHIISVLFFLFGKLKIKFRSRDKKFIILTNNKIEANLYINFGNSDNFSLEIFSNKERYLLKPLEQLKIFRKLEKETIGINNIYNPKIFKKLRENLKSKYKPGFNKQTKDFLKFVRKDIFYLKKIRLIWRRKLLLFQREYLFNLFKFKQNSRVFIPL